MAKIVVIGDCSLDAFLGIDEASVHARVSREERELSFKYGDKIPVESLSFLPGGNAANIAVGFSRLGLETAIITTIGTDELSEKIVKTFKKEKVGTSLLQKENGPSNFSASLNFAGERTLFTYHAKREYQLPQVPKTDWVYLTSMGEGWQKAYGEVCDFIKNARLSDGQEKVNLAFNPGSHQLEGDPGLLTKVLSLTTILFINKKEGQKILGEEISSPKEILVKLKKLGPKIVSLTDGANGSWAIMDEGGVFSLGIFPCKIIERTGAGDAYSAGFLGGLISGVVIEEAMRWGAVNAASVIEKVGAQTGLLTRGEIETKLKENLEFLTKAL